MFEDEIMVLFGCIISLGTAAAILFFLAVVCLLIEERKGKKK